MRHRLSSILALLLALYLLGQPSATCASEPLQGEIRLGREQDEPVWVGQEVELYLELWSNGLSFGDQLFVLPEVPGGFLLQGDATTVKLSETRDGVGWQGLRYTLLLYPQSAGRLEVPAFDVGFTARAGFGSTSASFRLRTEALTVEARLPPGASVGDLLVTTASFDLEAEWDRDLPADGPLSLQTGDALTLEVRRRAADVPGMVFAPLPAPVIDGLGVYPAKPGVRDQVNRGELTGTRTDRLTIVCESPGRYVIPEFRFQWWDPGAGSLSEKVIPALQIDVETNPAYGEGISTLDTSYGSVLRMVGLAGLALLLLVLGWRWFGGFLLVDRLRRWRRGRVAASTQPGRRSGRLLPLNPAGAPGSGAGSRTGPGPR